MMKEDEKNGMYERTAEEILTPYVWIDRNLKANVSVGDALKAMEEYRSLSLPPTKPDITIIEHWIKEMGYNNLAVYWDKDGKILRVADIIEHYLPFEFSRITSPAVESKSEGKVSVKDAEQFAIEFAGYMQGESWEYDYRESKTHSTAEHLEYFKQKYGPLI